MDKYVVSFEQAQQLKKAGFPQDTVYKYYQVIVTGEVKLIAGDFEDLTVGGKHTRTFAAPMTDELLNRLPRQVLKRGDRYKHWLQLEIADMPDGPGWSAQYKNAVTCFEFKETISPTASLAKLWLWCKDNNYLEGGES